MIKRVLFILISVLAFSNAQNTNYFNLDDLGIEPGIIKISRDYPTLLEFEHEIETGLPVREDLVTYIREGNLMWLNAAGTIGETGITLIVNGKPAMFKVIVDNNMTAPARYIVSSTRKNEPLVINRSSNLIPYSQIETRQRLILEPITPTQSIPEPNQASEIIDNSETNTETVQLEPETNQVETEQPSEIETMPLDEQSIMTQPDISDLSLEKTIQEAIDAAMAQAITQMLNTQQEILLAQQDLALAEANKINSQQNQIEQENNTALTDTRSTETKLADVEMDVKNADINESNNEPVETIIEEAPDVKRFSDELTLEYFGADLPFLFRSNLIATSTGYSLNYTLENTSKNDIHNDINMLFIYVDDKPIIINGSRSVTKGFLNNLKANATEVGNIIINNKEINEISVKWTLRQSETEYLIEGVFKP